MIGLLVFAAATSAPLDPILGDWQSVGTDRPIAVSYRPISNQLATVESWRTASGRETMTVYVSDGDQIVATHYCGQGNVAVLAAQKSDGSRDVTFAFRSAYGVDPGEGVLVRLRLESSGSRLRRTETYRRDGRDSVEIIEFARPTAAPK